MNNIDYGKYKNALASGDLIKYTGRVSQVVGLTIESYGPAVNLGELCNIYPSKGDIPIKAEVVGFKDNIVCLMPLGNMNGVGPGSRIEATGENLTVRVSESMLGRVLDGLGEVMDGKGYIDSNTFYPVENKPPDPITRSMISDILPVGIKAIDGLLTIGKGQRIGIFSGSGVGKSTLMGMIARNTKADVNVIGLVGERGREVREFIENDLQEEGLSRSVVVVATSDQPALIRLKAAQLATSVAEFFRDQGKDVMLMMDSLTRFAMAQREIGLALGEPPVSRGYTPSVFAIMPKLLERSGTSEKGTITGLYTVLVDGDDMNEPVTDTVRGILDGHIVLSRNLANRNHYPAIDVLSSVSRVMPNIIDEEHKNSANELKSILSVYKDAEDLINIGAYVGGSNESIDRAIDRIDAINCFLKQDVKEKFEIEQILDTMKSIVS
ncbi:MAG TPA: flagellar protein export ATPase FliI [Bacillota bacterium]|nr:flagellar protein export ATPase FliI [Bacillota bacterium]HOR85325.1 flagellar protein export ATPase FliI [Bacillota bacterium]HPL53736.1 flagellar protein export ATPase FliI [Bacillota bacterium]